MKELLQEINDAVLNGKKDEVEPLVRQALSEDYDPSEILDVGMIAAMREVGSRFENGKIFVPEMLISALAMKSGLELLKPHLVEAGAGVVGTVIIGSVKGDLHDIGKNLVAMMLEGAGFEVIDLGADVEPEDFVTAAQESEANIVGMSALLTTTMQNMKLVIEALDAGGVRDNVKVIVGGAPVNEDYAKEIGADGYAPDASRAVKLVTSLIS